MRRVTTYTLIVVAISVAALSVGVGYAYTADFQDQSTSDSTLKTGYIQTELSGDWKVLQSDGGSTPLTLSVHDEIGASANPEVHLEFTISGISEITSSSSGYVTITCGSDKYYAAFSGISGGILKIIGTKITATSGSWTGNFNISATGGSTSDMTTFFGSGVSLKIDAYHLEGSE